MQVHKASENRPEPVSPVAARTVSRHPVSKGGFESLAFVRQPGKGRVAAQAIQDADAAVRDDEFEGA